MGKVVALSRRGLPGGHLPKYRKVLGAVLQKHLLAASREPADCSEGHCLQGVLVAGKRMVWCWSWRAQKRVTSLLVLKPDRALKKVKSLKWCSL